MTEYNIALTGEMNETLLYTFLDIYNSIKKNKKINIYLNSYGGSVYIEYILRDIINKNKDNITLIATNEIFSAAFNLFFFSECNKYIMEGTIGMAHYSWTLISTNESGKIVSEYEKLIVKEMKDNKDNIIGKYQSLGFNDEELKKVKNGKDCYFNTKRLNELLNNGKD